MDKITGTLFYYHPIRYNNITTCISSDDETFHISHKLHIYWTDLDYELLLMLNQLILIVILVVRK